MESFWQDLRYAGRMLARAPGFTGVALLSLALGIGANTAIFTLIDAILLRSLPVHAPEGLVVLGDPDQVGRTSRGDPSTEVFSYPLFERLREHNQVLEGMFASSILYTAEARFPSRGPLAPSEELKARLVTGAYFSVLGIDSVLGRPLTLEDDVASAPPVAVISNRYWREVLAREPGVLGTTVMLNGVALTVVGIAPPGFTGEVVGQDIDIWLPMALQPLLMPGRPYLQDNSVSWLQVMGRLKPGVNLEAARAGIAVAFRQSLSDGIGGGLRSDQLERLETQTIPVGTGARGFSILRDRYAHALLLLLAMVGMVLLISCANVANLLLARATARRRELSIRLALGATRRRLVRQLLTESVLLSLLGGGLGLLCAQWGTDLLLALVSLTGTRIPLDTRPDLLVLLFTLGAALASGVLFGLAPAFRATREEPERVLRESGRGSTDGVRQRIGRSLVIGQVALSVLLLFGAGVFMRSLNSLLEQDLGYERDHLVVLGVDPIAAGYREERMTSTCVRLLERIRTVPGVRAATFSANGLFSGTEASTTLDIDGYTPQRDGDNEVYFDQVGPDYFQVLGIPLMLGRYPGRQDTAAGAREAVVNHAFARAYFGDASPIGRHIRATPVGQDWDIEIVGVVGDARDHSLREQPEPRVYLPFLWSIAEARSASFVIRTDADPGKMLEPLRRELRAFDPAIPVLSIRTLDELLARSVPQERLLARLAGLFGSLALLLAAIGLYGVMSYTVARRTSEIGIRMALGADGSNILRMVLRDTLRLVAIGLAVGIPMSVGAGRMVSSRLYGLAAADLPSLTAACALMGLVALLAGLVPAWRAARVDPLEAIRYS